MQLRAASILYGAQKRARDGKKLSLRTVTILNIARQRSDEKKLKKECRFNLLYLQ